MISKAAFIPMMLAKV